VITIAFFLSVDGGKPRTEEHIMPVVPYVGTTFVNRDGWEFTVTEIRFHANGHVTVTAEAQ